MKRRSARIIQVGTLTLLALLVLGCDLLGVAPPDRPPPQTPPPAQPDPKPRTCQYARAPAHRFNIEIEWPATYAEWLVAEVECAVAYWETAILNDLPDFVSQGRFFDAGVMIDDLLVTIAFVEDTPDLWGNPTAMAITTATIARAGMGLPYYSMIEFRLREARYRSDRGYLYNLARHEIAHAMGFGSIPAFYRLCRNGAQGGLFLGRAARRAAPGVPLYVTDGGHWERTGPLVIDLMATVSSSALVTRITLGAFEDLGYEVDYGMAIR